MDHPLILERELTTHRPDGGKILAVSIIQNDNAKWQINVDISWKSPSSFTVSEFDVRRIRYYKRAATAIRHAVSSYHYFGIIAVYPLEGQPLPNVSI